MRSAGVVEAADTRDLKSLGDIPVRVRIPPPAFLATGLPAPYTAALAVTASGWSPSLLHAARKSILAAV